MPRIAGLIAAAVLGITLPGMLAHAQQPAAAAAARGPAYYTIELLIFRSTANPASSEDLTAQSSRSHSGDSDSATGVPGPTNVRIGQKLPATRFRMNDTEARLNSSGAWRTVAHIAWTQTANAWGSRNGLSAAQLGLDTSGIGGAIYLERGELLHLGLNLTVAGNAGTYTLAEMRRVKFNERNYFDHPVYGVIAMVSPGGTAAPAPN
ncbi:MAG: hypothetical protein ABIT36_08640 [Steroidobacteraceae bacterium]